MLGLARIFIGRQKYSVALVLAKHKAKKFIQVHCIAIPHFCLVYRGFLLWPEKGRVLHIGTPPCCAMLCYPEAPRSSTFS
jgi:hypothetical protein